MKRFLVALQFLTIVPVRIKAAPDEKDFGASLAYFPLVGMCIGLALSVLLYACGFLPHAVAGAVVLVASIIMTGAVHLDGLADTCDGLFSGASKERMLEIMRDSRIGTMGVAGVVSVLLLKYAIFMSIPNEVLWKALVAASVFGRWSQSLACFMSDYAREEGKAKYFLAHAGLKEVLIGFAVTAGLLILLEGIKGIMLFSISAIPVIAFIYFIRARIGGMTGDTIGATNEIAETAALLSSLLLLGHTI